MSKTHFLKTEITYDLIDMSGVLHHPKYLVLCERGRTAALDCAGCPYPEMWLEGNGLAVADIHAEYFRPITMGQPITVLTRILELTQVRLNLEQMLIPSNQVTTDLNSGYIDTNLITLSTKELLFRATVKLVSISAKTLKPARFTEKLLQSLKNK